MYFSQGGEEMTSLKVFYDLLQPWYNALSVLFLSEAQVR